jgi:hypothetical protein
VSGTCFLSSLRYDLTTNHATLTQFDLCSVDECSHFSQCRTCIPSGFGSLSVWSRAICRASFCTFPATEEAFTGELNCIYRPLYSPYPLDYTSHTAQLHHGCSINDSDHSYERSLSYGRLDYIWYIGLHQLYLPSDISVGTKVQKVSPP